MCGCISLEKIVHMDITGEDSAIYSLAWILALVTDHRFTSKKAGNEPDPNMLCNIVKGV